ncbi:SOS response-associated peptidase family protein [Deefgea tanakiae]|uniref:SOS response-associated peptidase family protein n=1 Tax=Deefgea tanakiae TaxID=2865840 RepID=UPI003570DB74
MPFVAAELWCTWKEENGLRSYSFTQITINAEEHPLKNWMHKPADEKRNLVVIPETEYDNWLSCKPPELPRTFLKNYPAELMQERAL